MRGWFLPCTVPKSSLSCQVHYFTFLVNFLDTLRVRPSSSSMTATNRHQSGGSQLASVLTHTLTPCSLSLNSTTMCLESSDLKLLITFISFYINHHRKLMSPSYFSYLRFQFPECSTLTLT